MTRAFARLQYGFLTVPVTIASLLCQAKSQAELLTQDTVTLSQVYENLSQACETLEVTESLAGVSEI